MNQTQSRQCCGRDEEDEKCKYAKNFGHKKSPLVAQDSVRA